MFHQTAPVHDPFAGLANVEAQQIDLPGADRFNLWEQLRLPLAARTAGANVLHCPANTGPRYPLLPMILTIHDLIPLELEPDASPTRRWVHRVAAAARRATYIATVSEYSKRQLIRYLRTRDAKIKVVPPAVEGRAGPVVSAAEWERVAARYGLERDRPYVLAFGAADPRKNTTRILQAWGRLPEPLRRHAQLLVVGIQEDSLAHFRRTATEVGAGSACLVHAFVPEADLAALLGEARTLCYPSLAEGFGLPILEAYWSNTAVLTSNRSCLPEVAGSAALFVDPFDVAAIAIGLERLLTDDTLHADLVAKGRERRLNFSWKHSAECLARILAVAGRAYGSKAS
jgi:glycosyltransferase involved in cell wall biosynthesis